MERDTQRERGPFFRFAQRFFDELAASDPNAGVDGDDDDDDDDDDDSGGGGGGGGRGAAWVVDAFGSIGEELLSMREGFSPDGALR